MLLYCYVNTFLRWFRNSNYAVNKYLGASLWNDHASLAVHFRSFHACIRARIIFSARTMNASAFWLLQLLTSNGFNGRLVILVKGNLPPEFTFIVYFNFYLCSVSVFNTYYVYFQVPEEKNKTERPICYGKMWPNNNL